jgi:lysophospholipid acyltransferase (LPLAT)-like uncharacterized protein
VDTQQNRIPLDATSAALFLLGEVLGRTWRFSLCTPAGVDPFSAPDRGCMYAFWHSHLLPLSFYFRNTGKTAVISGSKDGARAAAVAQRWGHAVILGSSSRGGALALRACVRTLRAGNAVVITPDGPRGPRETVKPGVAQIALLADAPVFPVCAIARKAWRLSSWDRFMIPKPFTHVDITIGAGLDPAASAAESDPAAHLTDRIQKALSL